MVEYCLVLIFGVLLSVVGEIWVAGVIAFFLELAWPERCGYGDDGDVEGGGGGGFFGVELDGYGGGEGVGCGVEAGEVLPAVVFAEVVEVVVVVGGFGGGGGEGECDEGD